MKNQDSRIAQRTRRAVFYVAALGLALWLGPTPRSAAQSNRTHPPDNSQRGPRGAGSVPDDTKPSPNIQAGQGKTKNKDDINLNADLVTVVVTVTTKEGGNFASDLKAEDFELLEDNVPQTISSFSKEDAIPLQMAFLFDTSGSVRERRDFEKKAAIDFFKQVFRPQDHAAIYTVNTETTLELPLTNRLESIIRAVDDIRVERGATALYDGVYLSAQSLERTKGKRIIVILSDGHDNVSHYDLKHTLARAQDADTLIYAIHSYGRDVSANLRDPGAEQALISLAEETGGEAYFPARAEDLDQVFHRFAAELHSQYVLTFYSNNEKHDGTFRRLSARVKQQGLVVRTRKGYYAPKE